MQGEDRATAAVMSLVESMKLSGKRSAVLRQEFSNALLGSDIFSAAKVMGLAEGDDVFSGVLAPNEGDLMDEADLANGSASSSNDNIAPEYLRTYAESCPLPWNTFLRLRRSWGPIVLTPAQEESVFRALEKIPQGIGSIHDSLPFVTAFIEKHCQELRGKKDRVEPRPGATLLMLAVITGNARLCRECLTLGANPNSCKFLTDTDAPDNRLRHGYSPMFMACICEQLEIMTMLREFGGTIQVVDRWGRTPLHAAAAMGSREVLSWLIREGASRKVVDIDLQKPGEVCEGKVLPQLATTSVLFRDPDEQPLCHCAEGRTVGRCGCFDDMTDRWYADRLRSCWSKTYRLVRDDLLSTGMPVGSNQRQYSANELGL